MRNKQFDILLAIGIILVVMGHSHQPPYLFFPAYFFHIALFFFVSGYFFEIKQTFAEKFSYIKKKTGKQLIPYFVFNLLFAVITFLLMKKGINLGDVINFKSLVIRPFLDGHQFHLFLSAWFLLQIYCINIFAQGVFWVHTRWWSVTLWILGGIAAVFLLTKGLSHYLDWRLFIVRSSFGFLFFSLGMILRMYEPFVQKIILNNWFFIGCYTSIILLTTYLGNIKYSIVWGSVENTLVWVPLLTTFGILMLLYKISFHLTTIIKDESFLVRIGRKSFSIMIWHLFVFFLINCLLFKFGIIPKEKLSDVFFQYKITYHWMWYLIPAVLLPMYGAELFQSLKKDFKNKFPLKNT